VAACSRPAWLRPPQEAAWDRPGGRDNGRSASGGRGPDAAPARRRGRSV